MMIFDMKDASEIAAIAEPFFAGLNARLQLQPVMVMATRHFPQAIMPQSAFLIGPTRSMVHGVLGDGEQHDAAAISWTFCCRHDRPCGLWLHSHPETQEDPRQLNHVTKRRRIAVNVVKLLGLLLHRERRGEEKYEEICHIANRDFRDHWIGTSQPSYPSLRPFPDLH